MTDDVRSEFSDGCAPQPESSATVPFCRSAGFVVEHVRGGSAGGWGRRTVELDHVEIAAVLRGPPA